MNAVVGAKAMISTGATTRSSQAAPSGDFDVLDHASPDMAEAGPPRGEPGFCDALRYFRTTKVSRSTRLPVDLAFFVLSTVIVTVWLPAASPSTATGTVAGWTVAE